VMVEEGPDSLAIIFNLSDFVIDQQP